MAGTGRTSILVAVILAMSLSSARAHAQLFGAKQADWLVGQLAASENHRPAAALLGPYAAVVERAAHVDLSRFSVPSYDIVACVLDRAAEQGVSVAQLFADQVFLTDGPVAIALDAETLRRVEADFKLHSLFPLAINANDGKPLRMVFFVVGRGHLFIGYDRDAQATPPDPAYHIFSGKFEYRRLIRMRIARDADGGKVLSDIGTLPAASGASATFEPFRGPANSSVTRIKLTGTKAVVNAKLAFTISRTIDLPAIERRGPRKGAPASCPLLRGGSIPP